MNVYASVCIARRLCRAVNIGGPTFKCSRLFFWYIHATPYRVYIWYVYKIYRHVRIHISTHSTHILHTYGAIYGGIHYIYIEVYRHACRHLNAGPCNWQFNWKLDETNEHYILHKHYTVRPHGIVLDSMYGSVEEWVHHHWVFQNCFMSLCCVWGEITADAVELKSRALQTLSSAISGESGLVW